MWGRPEDPVTWRDRLWWVNVLAGAFGCGLVGYLVWRRQSGWWFQALWAVGLVGVLLNGARVIHERRARSRPAARSSAEDGS